MNKQQNPDPPVIGGVNSSIVFRLQLGQISSNGATPWVATVGLGTSPQLLRFMIDTGTDNTWITSAQCTTNACKAHQQFNTANSSSFRMLDPTPVEKSFGPWGTMTVQIGEDLFTLEQFTQNADRLQVTTGERMNFELATHYTGCQFQELVCDGGIAVPSPFWKGDGKTESLLLQLLKDGKISYAVASVGVNKAQGSGEFLFGAVDPTMYQASTLQWLAIENNIPPSLNYLWSIPLTNFLINGSPAQTTISSFVLDTGSSYFKGAKDLIDSLVNQITNNGALPSYVSQASELYNYPTIGLQIGNTTYYLTPQQYFIQLNSEYWEIGIQVLDGMPEGMLLVGSVFLDTVYTIFDYQSRYVGLAALNL